MRILLVDDSKMILRRHSISLLEIFPDAEIVTFFNPSQALEDLSSRELQFDLAFLDYNMPELDGVTLAKNIVSKNIVCEYSRVILVTANIQKAVEEKVIQLGMHFLEKPLEPAKAKDYIDKLGI